MIYPGSFPGVDRVIASNTTRLEELLVLNDASAPHAFACKIQIPPGVHRVVNHNGTLVFEDAAGRPTLTMAEPHAYDRTGEALAMRMT